MFKNQQDSPECVRTRHTNEHESIQITTQVLNQSTKRKFDNVKLEVKKTRKTNA